MSGRQESAFGRRQALEVLALGATQLLTAGTGWSGSEPGPREAVADPYQGLDWSAAKHVGSGTHIHCRSQRELEIMYRRGMRHLAISNYYPSAPCTREERERQFFVEQPFCTIKGKGYVEETFRWNEILADPSTGWAETLPPELREKMPFQVGGPIFHAIPDDVIICPNAEHHSTTDQSGHFNSVGSTFASGNFDVRSKHKLADHGYLLGLGMPWKEAFDRILDRLVYPDGGGITINHPVWSGQKLESVLAMLDHDPRVLGLEIWNHTCEQLNGKGWALEMWDQVLATGRRCYGFSVSDHVQSTDPGFLGYNVLLIDPNVPAAELPHACLKAYRDGRFYCVLEGKVRFDAVRLREETLTIETSEPCRIRIVSAAGKVAEESGRRLEWHYARGEMDRHRYLRVEADQIDGKDRLFSQPMHLV